MPDNHDTQKFLEVAKHAALAAGDVHKKYFRSCFSVETKSSSYDLVSQADIEAEGLLVKTVGDFYPDHNFLTEEKKYPRTASPYTWIIDPLDGTNNFVYGIPFFCVSIALAFKDTLITGVLYDVVHDELYTAAQGGGAFLNDRPICVRDDATLKEAMLITGFYYNRGEEMRRNLKIIEKFFEYPVLGLRRLGSAALDLCYVACGRATGFWEFGLSPWDFAAGILLVQEAGGCLTDGKNHNVSFMQKSNIVASNGKIHSAMLSVLQH